MKKRKKLTFIIISLILVISLVGLFFFLSKKEESLTFQEKQWIENNKSYVIDISVLSGVPGLTYNGSGAIFDFLDYLSDSTGLSFKPVVSNISIQVQNDYSFGLKNKIGHNDIKIYTDNYVFIDKNNQIYNDISIISNKKIGLLKDDVDKFKDTFNTTNQIVPFETFNEMLNSEEIDSYVTLKSNVVNQIISANLKIAYQFSITNNYVLSLNGSSELNSIIKKYYKKWSSDFELNYNKSLLNDYYSIAKTDNLDQANLINQEYTYGFSENGMYSYLKRGNLKGINYIILKSFSEFAQVKIKYKDYKDNKSLINDFNNKSVNIMLNNRIDGEKGTYAGSLNTDLMVVSSLKNNVYIHSISDLKKYQVKCIKDSKISELLKSNGIKIKTYNNLKTLLKSHNDKDIMVLEKENYDFYKTRDLKNYKIDYIINNFNYNYQIKSDNKLFTDLFIFYTNYMNLDYLVSNNYQSMAYVTIDYTLILSIIALITLVLLIMSTIKRIKRLIKKIIESHKQTMTKEDKLKYIDQLTSLKNRAYLNSKVEKWDDSENYPQCVIVIDLNNIAYINDNFGREEGDKVICEAANVLIQSQLPNTEIIRTDGNEFLIYAVGYNEKQIISYLRKLYKVLKQIKHGFGAAMGYSMILDAIKTFDDAVNEATIEMKQSKEDSLSK